MDQFKFLEVIGRGTHGTVFLFENKRKEPIVVKSINKKNEKYALREISILSSIKHKRIVEMLDFIRKKEKICIILEFANYGTLELFIRKIKFDNCVINMKSAWSIFSQLVDGISFLHKKFIIHRDIKPGNILLIEKQLPNENFLNVKICDFGLSIKTCDMPLKGVMVGTLWYMAPEIVRKDNYCSDIDIWSLGISIYELIALVRPFPETSRVFYKKGIVSTPIKNIPNCKDLFLEQLLLECLRKTGRINSSDLKNDERIRFHLKHVNGLDRDYQLLILRDKVNNLESKRNASKFDHEPENKLN
ncbi:Serine/threonine-protein kinase ULK3 [Dictyocoela muelleri]|nr:Serine/threonine-protein kinase ULK3 [Dictyocoela muelleri]